MKALDLFCGAGGASAGLHRAGFDVVGVDIRRQPRYPFEFHQADALDYPLDGFDLIWASPPCQGYTCMRAPGVKGAPRLIGAIRDRLIASGAIWVIENVEAAAGAMRNPITLCGSMFGLGAQGCRLQRHRLFEASFPIPQPLCRHDARPVIGVYGGHGRRRSASAGGRGTMDAWEGGHKAAAAAAMGISHMTLAELSEAIPPAYAAHVGAAAIAALSCDGASSNPRVRSKTMIIPDLDAALEDITKRKKEQEAADKAAARAKTDAIVSDLLPPPGQPWGTVGNPNIPIEDIVVGKRLRPLDEAEVQKKMDSIREVGLLTSITVTLEGPKGRPPRNEYRLRAGLHRLEAVRRLGWTQIPATVAGLVGLRAELIEVDENLEQTTLTPAQRVAFTARRKELYERLYPETKKGAAQTAGRKRAAADAGLDCKVCSEASDGEAKAKTPSFVEDTAAKTGASERSIALDAERAEKVAGDVVASITGTEHDKGVVLDELKRLPPEQQRTRVQEMKTKAAVPNRSSPSKGKGKSSMPKGPPVEHHGDGGDNKKQQDMLKRLDPIFDELWLGANPRENATKIENLLAERNFIPVSDRKRDPRKHLRELQAKAPKENSLGTAWGKLREAMAAAADKLKALSSRISRTTSCFARLHRQPAGSLLILASQPSIDWQAKTLPEIWTIYYP